LFLLGSPDDCGLDLCASGDFSRSELKEKMVETCKHQVWRKDKPWFFLQEIRCCDMTDFYWKCDHYRGEIKGFFKWPLKIMDFALNSIKRRIKVHF